MQDLNLEQKSEEIEKCCIICGDVIGGKKSYCPPCMKKRKLAKLKIVDEKRRKKVKVYPVWVCEHCGERIQLDFYPISNSFNNMKFDKIREEHYAKCEGVE